MEYSKQIQKEQQRNKENLQRNKQFDKVRFLHTSRQQKTNSITEQFIQKKESSEISIAKFKYDEGSQSNFQSKNNSERKKIKDMTFRGSRVHSNSKLDTNCQFYNNQQLTLGNSDQNFYQQIPANISNFEKTQQFNQTEYLQKQAQNNNEILNYKNQNQLVQLRNQSISLIDVINEDEQQNRLEIERRNTDVIRQDFNINQIQNHLNDTKQSLNKQKVDCMTENPQYINGSRYEADSSVRFMPSLIGESPMILPQSAVVKNSSDLYKHNIRDNNNQIHKSSVISFQVKNNSMISKESACTIQQNEKYVNDQFKNKMGNYILLNNNINDKIFQNSQLPNIYSTQAIQQSNQNNENIEQIRNRNVVDQNPVKNIISIKQLIQNNEAAQEEQKLIEYERKIIETVYEQDEGSSEVNYSQNPNINLSNQQLFEKMQRIEIMNTHLKNQKMKLQILQETLQTENQSSVIHSEDFNEFAQTQYNENNFQTQKKEFVINEPFPKNSSNINDFRKVVNKEDSYGPSYSSICQSASNPPKLNFVNSHIYNQDSLQVLPLSNQINQNQQTFNNFQDYQQNQQNYLKNSYNKNIDYPNLGQQYGKYANSPEQQLLFDQQQNTKTYEKHQIYKTFDNEIQEQNTKINKSHGSNTDCDTMDDVSENEAYPVTKKQPHQLCNKINVQNNSYLQIQSTLEKPSQANVKYLIQKEQDQQCSTISTKIDMQDLQAVNKEGIYYLQNLNGITSNWQNSMEELQASPSRIIIDNQHDAFYS